VAEMPVLTPCEGTTVLAADAEGRPYLLRKNIGKGKVLTFAANPFNPSAITLPGWWEFVRELQNGLGCQTGLDIWRFKFPKQENPYPEKYPSGLVCLTGNAWEWRVDVTFSGPNEPQEGTVSYSTAPDLVQEENKEKPLPFKKSDLFDRENSLNAKSAHFLIEETKTTANTVAPWAVAWNTGAGFDIKFEFRSEVEVAEVRLWAHGEIPEIKVYADGAEKKLLTGVNRLGETKDDVREIHLSFAPVKTKTLSVEFGNRTSKCLYLSELEIWGKPTAK